MLSIVVVGLVSAINPIEWIKDKADEMKDSYEEHKTKKDIERGGGDWAKYYVKPLKITTIYN